MAEMLAFPLLFLLSLLFFRSLVASVLPLMIGGLAIVGTFLHPARRQRVRLDLDLRPQPDHRRWGSGWRSTTASSSSPATARRSPRTGPGAGGDAAGARHRRAHGLLLLADRRRGARLAARLPAALPLLDGPRRRAGGAVRGADLADRAARGPDPARQPGQRRCAALPAAPRRGRRRGPHESGFWYRLSRFVMRRPIPVATLSAAAPDRPRAPLLRRSSSTPSTRTVLPRAASARQAYDAISERSSRPTTKRRSGSDVEGGDADGARRASRREVRAGRRASPKCGRRSRSPTATSRRSQADLRPPLRLRRQPGRR